MGYEFILETPISKTFTVKKKVAVETTRMVKRKGVMRKQRERKPALPASAPELPAADDLVVLLDADASPEAQPFEPLFEDYEEEIELEVAEKVFVEREEVVREELPAHVIRMADAHNDHAQNRMFTHYFVGRYVDEKWVPSEKTDGVVFSGDYYEKHKFQEMEELDERELLLAVVSFFGWKGDCVESPKDDPSDDFHDETPSTG